MSKILFIMDIEEGHILPSFAIARLLQEQGHEIVYLSISDNEDFVREQGFAFYPIFQQAYPKGYKHIYKQRDLAERQAVKGFSYIDEIIEGNYGKLFKELQADLFIVSDFLRIDILIMYHHFKLRPVIFTPFLRDEGITPSTDCIGELFKMPGNQSLKLIEFFSRCGLQFGSLEQLARPLDELPALIACPAELLTGPPPSRSNVVYLGPSIRQSAGLQQERYYKDIPRNKTILYASMGSQAVSHLKICLPFFGRVINMMRLDAMEGFHLILSIGPEIEKVDLPPLPRNVTVEKWVSQVDVLSICSLAIIHGGLGTVKECIYFGVPMIVLPLTRDQPSNAKRVDYHKLGIAEDINTVTETALASYILRILGDREIKESVDNMRTIFRSKELGREGTAAIENILAASALKKIPV